MKKKLMALLVMFALICSFGSAGATIFSADYEVAEEDAFLLVLDSFNAAYYNDYGAQALKSLGLFLGTGSGFELDRELKRSEAAAMIVRLYGAEGEAQAANYPHPFTDVPAWADPYIGWLYENGVTKGIADDRYGSESNIKIEHFLMMIMRLIELPEDENGQYTLPIYGWRDEESRFATSAETVPLQNVAGTLGLFGEGSFEMSNMAQDAATRRMAVGIAVGALHCQVEGEAILYRVLAKNDPGLDFFSKCRSYRLDDDNLLLAVENDRDRKEGFIHLQNGKQAGAFWLDLPERSGGDPECFPSEFLRWDENGYHFQVTDGRVFICDRLGALYQYDRGAAVLTRLAEGPEVVFALPAGDRVYVIVQSGYAMSDGVRMGGEEIGVVENGVYSVILGNDPPHGIYFYDLQLSSGGVLTFSSSSAVGQMKWARFYYVYDGERITVLDFTTDDYEFAAGDEELLKTRTAEAITEEQARLDAIHMHGQ